MNNHIVVSVGREYGSGGKEISQKLADKLHIKCYDNELLTLAASESGYCEDIFKNNDEKPTNSFLYSLVMNTYSLNGVGSSSRVDMPWNQKIFLAQFETIKHLAETESCVIVGRCADYALADDPDCCSLFINAPMDFRISRIKNEVDLTDDNKIADYIRKTDKRRASYYNYYSEKKWGDARSYNFTINSAALGIDKTVDFIIEFLKLKYPIQTEYLLNNKEEK